MGISRTFCLGFCGAQLLCASLAHLEAIPSNVEHRILFLAHQGQFQQAIQLYEQAAKKETEVDYRTLQQLALCILKRAVNASDSMEQMLGLYGSALSSHMEAMSLLTSGLEHPLPQIQLISMDLLGRLGGDESEVLLQKCASSPNLLTRLLALQILLQGHHPVAFGHLEALYRKAPAALHPLFPSFFAMSHDPKALNTLRRMLHDPVPEVRLATLLTIAEQGKEELMSQLRICIGRVNPREQEIGAYAAGQFQDRQAIPLLLAIGKTASAEIQLARLIALKKMGEPKFVPVCVELARQGNLFAIHLLGELEEGEDILVALCATKIADVRYNAALALLKRNKVSCLPIVMELLVEDPRDLAISRISSPGMTLQAYRLHPSATLTQADMPALVAQSLEIRKGILSSLLTLPGNVFFETAELLFKRQQNDLVPAIVDLLVKIGSRQAQELLCEAQNQVGAPFVRMCACIGLYRLNGRKAEGEKIQQWLFAHKDKEMIDLVAQPTQASSSFLPGYTLTPEQDTLLFLSALEAVVEKQQTESVSMLLQLLASGNVKNQPLLAGLLLRSTQ